jgi:high-affinity nickel-transport protein
MKTLAKLLFSDGEGGMRGKVVASYFILIGVNIIAWGGALITFRHDHVLLGFATLAYAFGLRHAVDADHIAAIDIATRKLMQQKQRPATVGFFFAIGHSLVLVIATAVIALTAMTVNTRFAAFNNLAGIIGTSISAIFLFAMAFINVIIARAVYKTFKQVQQTGVYVDEDLDILLNSRGFMARLLRPLFRLVSKSWHMFPIGFLFGLGFDTATEVSLLSIAGAEAVKGVSVWSIMIFPALFAAGMSLIDTTDGILMLGAYGWAFVKPIRKLYTT